MFALDRLEVFKTGVTLCYFVVQVAQSAMFSKFIETEKHENNAWQLQKRLQEASAAIDDRLRQHYKDPQVLQLVR